MVGKPDWQEVPRGFSARQLLNEVIQLNAGATTSRTIVADDADDVVAVYVGSGAGNDVYWTQIQAKNPLGDVVHTVRAIAAGGGSVWLPVQSFGGDIVITLRQAFGLNGGNANLRAWSYIGIPAIDLMPQQRVYHNSITALGAGATFAIEPYMPSILCDFAVICTMSQAFVVEEWVRTPNSDTAPTNHNNIGVARGNAAAGGVVATSWRHPGVSCFLFVRNSGGVAANGNISIVQRLPR